ncbi:MAG: GNAT family N-acetyltransferase [Oscillatoriales cyanobacterium RU_3_3]|nr:GNAT family N-acetyltransferase [Microcoleus sp. SU_5_3]NJL67020.1 GNAT family N-acetyltransferase [Microcoleus sp. SM1_3_4]NJM59789.1 GNAT family N-acetyltransferase [Oscillatoriales cyanobacterium RU_3_3]NJR22052.1 GNAT family N-acetyltransferase [Richelia sp. CSU_2_1]
MNFQIRRSQPEELEQIIELQSHSLRELLPSYDSIQIESLVRSQASARLTRDEIIFVVENEGKIVGFVTLLDQISQIGGVFVHPNLMRQGLGTRLLKTVENIAIDREHEVIHVLSSLATVKFYEANGYRFIRQSGFYSELKIWIPCVILNKQLIRVSIAKQVYRYLAFLVVKLPILPPILFLAALYFVVDIWPIIIDFMMSLLR